MSNICGLITFAYNAVLLLINYEIMQPYLCFSNDNFNQILIALNMLFIADKIIKIKIFDCSTRWFVLHVAINGFVVYLTFNDMVNALTNIENAHKNIISMTALNSIVALHFYHMLFFDNLCFIDWLHHILMMYVAVNVYNNSSIGSSINYILFYVSGLPGGIDYAMLILVKYKYMQSITEKRLNTYLNVWIRSPFLVVGTYLLYLSNKITHTNVNPYICASTIILLFWNAQYFAYRITSNFVKSNNCN